MQEVSLSGIPTKNIYAFPISPTNAKKKTAVDKHNFHHPKKQLSLCTNPVRTDIKDFYSKTLLSQNS